LKKTLDKPFDEVHELSESNDDSHASPSTSPTHHQKGKGGAAAAAAASKAKSFGDSDENVSGVSGSLDSSMASPPPAPKAKKDKKDKKKDKAYAGKPGNVAQASAPKPAKGSDAPLKAGGSSDEDEDEDSASDEDEASASAAGVSSPGGAPGVGAKLYNPADYAHLKVSSELSDLFQYILRHKPADIELETKMKPFIPDYIPAVGEIDAFLKVPRPDRPDPQNDNLPSDGKASGKKSGDLRDLLGLVVLDEPAAAQSDPTVLELSLRAVNKQVISRHATVGSIEYANRNTARVVKWIQSIEEIHRKKPPPHVHYARAMPDIEQLMQVWPPAFEEMLKQTAQTHGQGPNGNGTALPDVQSIDCDVAQFARMVCALMDIPVYDKLTESLHVLFTLYSEFQNHAYFQH
jgi:intraflagellar transport protein 46